MSLFNDFMKKISVFIFVVLAVALANIESLRAAAGGDCCSQTATNTLNIYNTVKTFPDIYSNILKELKKITFPDNGQTTAPDGTTINSPTPQLVANFGNYDNAMMANDDAKPNALAAFSPVLFTNPDPRVNPKQEPGKPETSPEPYENVNQNELSYSTILNPEAIKKEEREKYIKTLISNLSGIKLYHQSPYSGSGWEGPPQAFAAYERFFNTILATQSYNSYILGGLYTNYQNGNQLNSMQKQLVQQASDTQNWFAQVGSEPIALVMRQLLLYTSQLFVVQTEMLKMQQDSLYTQAVSNTLLMLIAQYSENQLLRSAQSNR